MTPPTYDVLTMGRVGVDIYPRQVGVPLDEVDTFGKSLGGSATNVAVAAARHGRSAAVITRTGRDPFGRFIHRALRSFGVDDRFVTAVPGLPTPVTFCEMFPPDHFPLYFYRFPKAPDLEIRASELDLDAIRRAAVFWITVTGLSDEPSRTAHHEALAARHREGLTVLDLDYRPMFWPSRLDARREVQRVLGCATVVVGNEDEFETAVGERDPRAAAASVLEAGAGLVVVKLGPAGVIACTRDETVAVAAHPVEVVNGLGAGDGFGGALCHGLLGGWPLATTIRFANVAGALVAGRVECSSAMPTTAEVNAAIHTAAEPS